MRLAEHLVYQRKDKSLLLSVHYVEFSLVCSEVKMMLLFFPGKAMQV